jgi:tRNA G46 methylase TrmB
VEFGCGYGTFTIPASKAIKGKVYAIDIEEEMTKRVADRANEEKINNINTMLRDFVYEALGLNLKVRIMRCFLIFSTQKNRKNSLKKLIAS